MIQAAKPAMTASIKVASRALNSSRFSCRQESFVSFTVCYSELFSPHTMGNSSNCSSRREMSSLAKFFAAPP